MPDLGFIPLPPGLFEQRKRCSAQPSLGLRPKAPQAQNGGSLLSKKGSDLPFLLFSCPKKGSDLPFLLFSCPQKGSDLPFLLFSCPQKGSDLLFLLFSCPKKIKFSCRGFLTPVLTPHFLLNLPAKNDFQN